MPLAEVEARGNLFVDAGEMPVAEKLGRVRGSSFKRAMSMRISRAARGECRRANRWLFAKVAIRAFQRVVEQAIVGFEFGELEVRQFHDVERFIEKSRGSSIKERNVPSQSPRCHSRRS